MFCLCFLLSVLMNAWVYSCTFHGIGFCMCFFLHLEYYPENAFPQKLRPLFSRLHIFHEVNESLWFRGVLSFWTFKHFPVLCYFTQHCYECLVQTAGPSHPCISRKNAFQDALRSPNLNKTFCSLHHSKRNIMGSFKWLLQSLNDWIMVL